MATEALVKRIKEIMALGKAGQVDEAYTAYAEFFRSPEFRTFPMDEQRHAIKLVVNCKVAPSKPKPTYIEAHKAAMVQLEELIGALGNPEDFQLLGICCLLTGDEKRAAGLFRAGLSKERERNPQSDLCGSLMKWVAAC